ncbi:capsule biosynthesis protein CapA [Amylibacter ulvae]|uniref:Capsule biosynthesis protein CapA n=1 Tax=Paramylibacter ulvae TaxID=1651968 RepID=A0ABQ3D5Q7_9RHOB|nr:capsule biosynthesis protein CapA [Amylibacter ulvae]GHA54231.1 capsule biosynthesis protein CapA [Amylibacter ulvae]
MSEKASQNQKHFVFLQGPHGPFFFELSRTLMASGAKVTKIGFNQGDRHYWRDAKTYVPFADAGDQWAEFFKNLLGQGITDLVLYGDVRSHHKTAIKIAEIHNVTIHCFEEGYLRPYWATYERGGVNGHSRLMDMSVGDMRKSLAKIDETQPEAPARWGDMRKHIFFGAMYHWHVMFRNGKYPHYRPHRNLPVSREFWHHFKKLVGLPIHSALRFAATRRLKRSGNVYHLVLLQLSHDASIQDHSDFESTSEFMDLCITEFAANAPRHHHLVIKAHPLEDYRIPLEHLAHKMADQHGLADRLHFIRGGKLAELLDYARSVVTVNSTAAQQALWRGLPIRALGNSVYSKPEFTSNQPLGEFFAHPRKPDLNAYRDYRRYLLATSQVSGGFYARTSRVRLARQVVDMVLSDRDPYDLLLQSDAAPVQQLKLVL